MKSCYYLNIREHTVIYELDVEANVCNDSHIHSSLLHHFYQFYTHHNKHTQGARMHSAGSVYLVKYSW